MTEPRNVTPKVKHVAVAIVEQNIYAEEQLPLRKLVRDVFVSTHTRTNGSSVVNSITTPIDASDYSTHSSTHHSADTFPYFSSYIFADDAPFASGA